MGDDGFISPAGAHIKCLFRAPGDIATSQPVATSAISRFQAAAKMSIDAVMMRHASIEKWPRQINITDSQSTFEYVDDYFTVTHDAAHDAGGDSSATDVIQLIGAVAAGRHFYCR